MTANKDLKRLVRTRMSKTGESYTAARTVLVARRPRPNPPALKQAAPPEEWAKLAGKSDAIMKTRTGRTWVQWVAFLDKAGAHEMKHPAIARLAEAESGVNGWWAQAVTVGYERIRGMREVGQRCDGKYDASKSKTFNVAVSTLYEMFADTRKRKSWLPEGVARVRTATESKAIRFDWTAGTRVNVNFLSKGPGKSSAAVQHERLASKADIARLKIFWDERFKTLAEALG